MHKLLERQLRRTVGNDPDAWTPEVKALIGMVDAAYVSHDDDRALIERSLELSSQELSAKNDALARARDEADAASRSKSSFLANMSHEMRTPLNAVIGYSELLLEEVGELSPEELVPELEKIRAAGKHLLGLINDVLDLSKIEAGRMDVRIENVDVRAIASEVVSLLGGAASQRENELVLKVEGPHRYARADAGKLRQTLVNLVGNAIKFTHRGRIEVALGRASAQDAAAAGIAEWGPREAFTIAVRDSGIGIAPDALPRLFTPFTQADASTSRRYGGTGLGLSLARRFCQMMGGEVTIASSLGVGSTFTVWLGATEATESRPPVGTMTPQPLAARTWAVPEAVVATAAPAPATRTDGPVVMVVDDDPAAIQLVERVLGSRGYAVVGLDGGALAVERAVEVHPHVILLDVVMPEVDGWRVLAALKRDARTRDIPVVMTSIAPEQDLGFTLGAAEYLVKPLDWDRLFGILSAYRHDAHEGDALVVDDDPAARELHRRALSRAGWDVREAADGRAALEAARARRPAVVLLDLTMPGMDGFSFVEHLHADPALHDVPVVVVTGRELTPEEQARLETQVARVLQKGNFDRSALLRTVARVVAPVGEA